jgi:hypothetical protein
LTRSPAGREKYINSVPLASKAFGFVPFSAMSAFPGERCVLIPNKRTH